MEERFMQYMEEGQSIYDYTDGRVETVLATVSTRYMGNNPAHCFGFCAYQAEGFKCRPDGRFDLDLSQKLSDARYGQSAWIKTKFYQEGSGSQEFLLSCYGPVEIILNGEKSYRSTVRENVNYKIKKEVTLTYKHGWNELNILCQKTASGFGCIFGVTEPRWNWLSFMAPGNERKGKLGFIYSEAFDGRRSVCDQELLWFPDLDWPEEAKCLTPAERIYEGNKKGFIYGWTSFTIPYKKDGDSVRIRLNQEGAELYLDGELALAKTDRDSGIVQMNLSAGKHDVVVRWEVSLADKECRLPILLDDAGREMAWELPAKIHGTNTSWLYLGISPEPLSTLVSRPELYQLYGKDDKFYWRLDEPSARIRPVLHNQLFGRWNYPLGVTLYGLIAVAQLLADQSLMEYARAHIRECVLLYEYSLWDKHEYGYPEINNQLATMSMLDDCGSFGSAMLELSDESTVMETKIIADDIAFYMKMIQERQPDQAFYRKCPGHYMENTLWVDDLYMSIPFLCRYYKLSGEREYLDDAANQLLLFKQYLFQPEQKIMSHVYDFKYHTDTKMPWGRGNGWCFFSITELLEVLPEAHRNYHDIRNYYNQLAEGYLALQGSRGLWHQLLTHPDSYEETSCTAMFVYGLCRGLRFGWLNGTLRDKAWLAAERGWEGITKNAIDQLGNIHGICGGSAYSFTSEYYKQELLWCENDPHGIGIVLLAGVECCKALWPE